MKIAVARSNGQRQAVRRFAYLGFGLLPTAGMLASAAWMMRHATAIDWGRPALIALASVQCIHFLMQALLWLRYQPFEAPTTAPLPTLTIVIPAYNEGAMVGCSIRSVVEDDYPPHLLQVIVVDDGSRDDTYFHVEQWRRRYPDLIRVIRFAGNQGKRAGLHAAFQAARGEVVATLDSDSEIAKGTLRALVAPLQADPRIGAVAGRVSVLNRNTWIGRMLEVQYALAFDFGRAAQSSYRAVACCPGALSAFRRSVVLPQIDRWLNQRFLGRPVAHGEDQALTNIVLRLGFDTVYQRTAVVHTLAPGTYRQLARMFTRWDRSFIVEGFAFARFMFTRYRAHNRLLPAVAFILNGLRLVLFYLGLAMLPAVVLEQPGILLDYAVAFTLAATFTALYYLHTERSLRFMYGVMYAFYAFFLLQWTLAWALITVRDERWGTR